MLFKIKALSSLEIIIFDYFIYSTHIHLYDSIFFMHFFYHILSYYCYHTFYKLQIYIDNKNCISGIFKLKKFIFLLVIKLLNVSRFKIIDKK
jgi:hypothetical protein